MKTSFFIAAFAALSCIACNNKSKDNHAHDAEGNHLQTQGTHMHDDGSVHNDGHEANTTVEQEKFKVEQDSTAHRHYPSNPHHKH